MVADIFMRQIYGPQGEEDLLMASEEYQENIVVGIVRGLEEFFE